MFAILKCQCVTSQNGSRPEKACLKIEITESSANVEIHIIRTNLNQYRMKEEMTLCYIKEPFRLTQHLLIFVYQYYNGLIYFWHKLV